MLRAAGKGPFDVVIVGGGPGGYVAAIKAAQLGLKTACVEGRGALGGTCLNVGCIPSKALLNSSHMYHDLIHKFANHGVMAENPTVDLEKVMAQKDTAVKGLTQGIEHLFKKNKVEYFKGWGSIPAAGKVQVSPTEGGEEVTLEVKNIVIATGSEPSSIPNVTIDDDAGKIVSSTGALKLKEIPKDMIVIGGGVIGLEMGSVWSRFGSNVRVVEFLDKIVAAADADVVKTFTSVLKKQGFKFNMKTKVMSATVDGDKVLVETESVDGSKSETLTADVVLVSTGRRPNTDGLGLEALGVTMERGMITVDGKFQTNVPGIFAIGDVIAGPMLAHKAEEDGVACVEGIAGKGGHVNYATVPNVIYTHPEVAWVGKTEAEVKADGVKYNVGKFPFQANSRARTVADADGIVKIISDSETDKILGMHIVSANAGELIAEGVLGMEYGASSEDIARTCHAHPTLSEAVKEAAMATYDKAIHF